MKVNKLVSLTTTAGTIVTVHSLSEYQIGQQNNTSSTGPKVRFSSTIVPQMPQDCDCCPVY